LTVVTHDPKPPHHYKRRLATVKGLAHATVEVHCFEDELVPDDAESRKTVSDLP